MEAHIAALANHPQMLLAPEHVDLTRDNDYEYVKSLKSGGQGDCTLVRSRPTKQLYVVKQIREWDPHDNRHTWRKEMVFLTEYLKPHPNLLRPYAFELRMWVERQLYFEYCSGGDLQGLMAHWQMYRAPAPPAFLLHLFIQLVDAFAYLHHSLRWDPKSKTYQVKDDHPCIVHSDVKPENILIRWVGVPGEGFPEIVLCDFGLSKDYTNGHSHGFDGTSGWFAPEIQSLIDQKQTGQLTSSQYKNAEQNFNMEPSSDIYGLGLVIGSMFDREFRGRSNPSQCEYPQEMKDLKFPFLVAKCLDVDPTKRWIANYDPKLGMMRHVEDLRTIMDGLVAQGKATLSRLELGPTVGASTASPASDASPPSSTMMEMDS